MFSRNAFHLKYIPAIVILATLGPILTWIAIAGLRYSHQQLLASYICKVSEPRLQVGAFREVQDYLISSTRLYDSDLAPNILLEESGQSYESNPNQKEDQSQFNCKINGRTDVKLSFSFNRYRLNVVSFLLSYVIAAFLIWAIINLFESVTKKMAQRRSDEALGQLALQIAHDIRSPLSALNLVVFSGAATDTEKNGIIANATQRINDIANEILNTSRKSNKMESRTHLNSCIERLIEEKRVQFSQLPDFLIVGNLSNTQNVLVNINSTDFGRAISNLLNNAAEATSNVGRIEITTFTQGENCVIKITDNGKGISPERIQSLGVRGQSLGKTGFVSGFGMGIHQARMAFERVSGRLDFQSKLGEGTTVTITIPIAKTSN